MEQQEAEHLDAVKTTNRRLRRGGESRLSIPPLRREK